MNITIIGGGNMGFTFAEGFLASQIVKYNQLTIIEKNKKRFEQLEKLDPCKLSMEIDESVQKSKLVVLAVKPQNAQSLYHELNPHIKDKHIVLSIMAGVTIENIQKALGTKKVVRAMPNLPAQIGFGMTVFSATNDVSREDLFEVQNLLSTTGKSIYVENEDMIDAATAVSGSGPAYVFYFIDAMMEAAKKLGFTATQAELLVEQTFMGAIHSLRSKDYSCKEWIQMVSSKGGTTEAAIKEFETLEVHNDIVKGLEAAYKRAKDLSKE